jgi:hypothetical protein
MWEALTGERLFDGDNQGRIVRKILDEPVPLPSDKVPGLPKALDEVVMRGLERDITKRFQTAREFATALERCLPQALPTEVGEWVESIGGTTLGDRAKRVKEIESRADIEPPVASERRATTSVVPTKTEHTPIDPQIFPMNPTVPQAFAVMTSTPMDPPSIVTTEPPPTAAPPPRSEPRPAPVSGTQRARIAVPSPFAPMPVQTLAVKHLAGLDPVPVPFPPEERPPLTSIPPPSTSRRLLVVLLVIVLCAIAGGGVTWLVLGRM